MYPNSREKTGLSLINDHPQLWKISTYIQPLHTLTKNTVYQWTAPCQIAFDLNCRLIEIPVLSYPDFTKEFTLETDPSITGLGAVLSQVHDDGKGTLLLLPVEHSSNKRRTMAQMNWKHWQLCGP